MSRIGLAVRSKHQLGNDVLEDLKQEPRNPCMQRMIGYERMLAAEAAPHWAGGSALEVALA